MNTFNEADHPRGGNPGNPGQFSVKTHKEAECGLDDPDTYFEDKNGMSLKTIADVARERDMQPHEVAAFLGIENWDSDNDQLANWDYTNQDINDIFDAAKEQQEAYEETPTQRETPSYEPEPYRDPNEKDILTGDLSKVSVRWANREGHVGSDGGKQSVCDVLIRNTFTHKLIQWQNPNTKNYHARLRDINTGEIVAETSTPGPRGMSGDEAYEWMRKEALSDRKRKLTRKRLDEAVPRLNQDAAVDGILVAHMTIDEDRLLEEGADIEQINVNNVDAATRQNLADEFNSWALSNADDVNAYLERGLGSDGLANDYMLTSNGHGTGFRDRGLGELGDRLSESTPRIEVTPYLGDDGKIYLE